MREGNLVVGFYLGGLQELLPGILGEIIPEILLFAPQHCGSVWFRVRAGSALPGLHPGEPKVREGNLVVGFYLGGLQELLLCILDKDIHRAFLQFRGCVCKREGAMKQQAIL